MFPELEPFRSLAVIVPLSMLVLRLTYRYDSRDQFQRLASLPSDRPDVRVIRVRESAKTNACGEKHVNRKCHPRGETRRLDIGWLRMQKTCDAKRFTRRRTGYPLRISDLRIYL